MRRYEQWYDAQPTPSGQIFNSGVEGGARGVLLRFLERVTAVLDDPQLAARQEQKTVNVDMSALNWVLHTESAVLAEGLAEGPQDHLRSHMGP